MDGFRIKLWNGWKKIADQYFDTWNFPNCVGAVDGKHIIIQNFKKSGSAFHNYKGTFNTILLACCDAQYRFTLLSIGSAGREGDAGIFQSVDFGQCILRERLPLPGSETFKDFHEPFPALLVGDAAFPLRINLMRPYGGTNLRPAETIFNYRLSKARRVVENASSILSSRFRIFRKPILATASTVDKIVHATCVLHNWLRTMDIEGDGPQRYITPDCVDSEENGILRPGQWRDEGDPTGLRPVAGNVVRNSTTAAKALRNHLRDFFMTFGQVPWQ